MRKKEKLVLLLVAACAIQACLDGPKESETVGKSAAEILSENKAKWEKSEPGTYGYIYWGKCACPPGVTGPLKIISTKDSLTKVAIIRTGSDSILEEKLYAGLSIDSIFSTIETMVKKGAYKNEMTFDATSGFPKVAKIDLNTGTADDNYDIAITEFNPNER